MTANGRYILDASGEPLPCEDLMTWARWMEDSGKRVVARDEMGDVCVSTVFLGLDYSFGMCPLLLWETMIFGGPHDSYQERYSTREDAVAGHAVALALAKEVTS